MGAAGVEAKKLFTTIEVAEMLRVTPKTVREMALDGRLDHIRIGKLYRFDPGVIHALFLRPSSLKIERGLKLVTDSPKKKGKVEWL